jgi:SAM-dependent methyltransferase
MKKMDYDMAIHAYLQTRSIKSIIYRRYWLYKKLAWELNGKTLDLGAGLGDFVSYRKNTIGVEINPYNVKWCKSKGLDVRLMEVDKLPFTTHSFDSIVMDNVLEHINDPTKLLSEIGRVLRNGGTLLIGVPGVLGFASDPDHKVFYSKELLVETFTNLGFSEKKIFSMPFESKWLDSRIKQYCYYGVFIKN